MPYSLNGSMAAYAIEIVYTELEQEYEIEDLTDVG
jgi:hypothetical protein